MTGNLTNFIYNSQNQLILAEVYVNSVKVKSVEFYYDPLGRRIQKNVIDPNLGITTSEKFEYDSNEIIGIYNESNNLLVTYNPSYLQTDDMISMNVTSAGVSRGLAPSAGVYYFTKDALGSVKDIRTATGVLVQKMVYSTFGRILSVFDNVGNDITSAPIVAHRFTFTGREYEKELNLYYYRARYYDAHAGKFVQKDPIAGNIYSPLTLFSYIYVLNNPRNGVDPTGAFTFSIGGIFDLGLGWGFAIGGGIVFAHDDEKSFNKGWEVGFYFTSGQGAHAGIGGGAGLQFGVSANDHLSELSGGSLDVGISGGYLERFGLGVSIPLSGEGSPVYNGTIGFGAGASQNTYVGYTWISGQQPNQDSPEDNSQR